MIKNKLLQFGAVLQFLVLTGFVVLFLLMLLSGSINMYVSPQIEPFVWFGTVVMFIMAFVNLRHILRLPRKHTFLTPYIIFFIPLALMIVFSPVTLMSKDLPSRTIDHTFTEISQGENQDANEKVSEEDPFSQTLAGQADPQEKDITMNVDFLGEYFQPEILEPQDEQVQDKLKDGVKLDSDNYYKWYYNFYHNPEEFKGSEITFEGFVYLDDELKTQGQANFEGSDEEEFFWSARFLMVCCVADMILIGMPVHYPEAEDINLDSDTWVQIEGTIESFDMNGSKFPIVNADVIRKVDQSGTPYVFPF